MTQGTLILLLLGLQVSSRVERRLQELEREGRPEQRAAGADELQEVTLVLNVLFFL